MVDEYCWWFVCFVPLKANAPKFFGFAEFLAALALMVLAWTIAEFRYQFRVRTAPLPLRHITFAMVAAVGLLTLLTDLWRAEQWHVPEGDLLTPEIWQALLGATFFCTFLAWAWFAFIRPPVYGKRNAERYVRELYRVILKGSSSELAIVADEFAHSVRSVIRYATEQPQFAEGQQDPRPRVAAYADDLLLLIADRKFCRAVIESSSGTALAIFQELAETEKYRVQIGTFARNVVGEAFLNKDSFLFHETAGYESGLIGYVKPLSKAMFGNYRMVETIGTLLDATPSNGNAAQWEAYCRLVLVTFRDYVNGGMGGHSFVLHRAKGYIQTAVSDLYKIDGMPENAWDDDIHNRLHAVVKFIRDAVDILDKKGVPPYVRLRIRNNAGPPHETFYDHLASMIFEVVFRASCVRSPQDLCWAIQYGAVWGELFEFGSMNSAAGKVVKFKARRLIYDEIIRMGKIPNFKRAGVLGFCLNIMGLACQKDKNFRDTMALHKAVLSWTTKHFVWLYAYNSRVGEACLINGISYEAENRRLVRTYPAEGLRRQASTIYLDLDPAPEESVDSAEN
ncbi:hypothetical protein GNZ12_26655 [Paraburkholderia sp. 1N]|uniref:Phage abortive infection protein n=1 Tax=Paraburkholderia solitsugae TaxID=2675748 RepID=A0ABX2BW07_9BURK|nr:hypothetical protein [Paraburkholderia solitsugae]NPT44834.1 hypothetical protein [Paraburkholderia solitsugae]